MRRETSKHDKRYTIAREYCGQVEPQYVARFCGEWLGRSANKSDARNMCDVHRENLISKLTASATQ